MIILLNKITQKEGETYFNARIPTYINELTLQIQALDKSYNNPIIYIQ